MTCNLNNSPPVSPALSILRLFGTLEPTSCGPTLARHSYVNAESRSSCLMAGVCDFEKGPELP